MRTQKNRVRPIAALISDVHYSLGTLNEADSALRAAAAYASIAKVPLIIAGDLHDTKANLRGECANKLVKTLSDIKESGVKTYILIGNHDLLNEKSAHHSLNFLRPYVEQVIDVPNEIKGLAHLIPYQADPLKFEAILSSIPKNSLIICHQGVTGADMGDYVLDKSAIPKEILADYRVISGHYHKTQDIKCGRLRAGAVGLMSYIGSPYTVTYAEAKDGSKGFQILSEDGLLTQVPLNLRKHIIAELEIVSGVIKELQPGLAATYTPGDLLWIKAKGTHLDLDALKKADLTKALNVPTLSFKLDKVPMDIRTSQEPLTTKSNPELMDSIIDASGESDTKKAELKKLWREL